jgi:hypothetical protein
MTGRVNRALAFVVAQWQEDGAGQAAVADLLKNEPNGTPLAAKKPQLTCRNAGWDAKLWNYDRL